jgi:hypothetical protein
MAPVRAGSRPIKQVSACLYCHPKDQRQISLLTWEDVLGMSEDSGRRGATRAGVGGLGRPG